MLEAFGQAFSYFSRPDYLAIMLGGVLLGLVMGIIPGVGGMMTLALFLPFAFKMQPAYALTFMIALGSVTATGGGITAILVGVPGESYSAATLLDGYPMAKKGQASRALGAALGASGLGGMLTVFWALALVPAILPIIKAVRTADMVFLTLLGISFIAVLGRGSMLKGFIAGFIGLFCSLIGFQQTTAVSRFTFGSLYMYDGISLISMGIGLFAIPEMIALATEGGSIAKKQIAVTGLGDVWQGVLDVFRHWGVWLRSSIIGFVVGIIPGIGSTTAVFVAYAQAKQTSKHPEMFGTGVIEGVIAPESADNAKEAGALLTTLALGVPGSAGMAILLGGMLIVGLTPGPEMMTRNLGISLNLFLVIIVANLIGAILCILLAPKLAKVVYVPDRYLVPIVLVATLVGAYGFRQEFNDMIVALVFGALGLGMKEFGFPRPAMFLGFVLGDLFEKYVFTAYALDGWLFWVRPISLALIAIIIAAIIYELRATRGGKRGVAQG